MIIDGFYYPDWIWKNKLRGGMGGSCALNFCIGNRKAGKSVGVGLLALADYFCYGYKTVLLRRYMRNFEDRKRPAMENFWEKSWGFLDEIPEKIRKSPILRALYPDEVLNRVDWKPQNHELRFEAHTAFIDNELFSYPVAINLFNDYKNSNFINVHTIIYDEFISEDGSRLPGEVSAVYNLYDTIARGRDDALQTTSIIFISNAITLNSPFLVELGIDREMRRDTKRLYRPDASFCVEMVNNEIAADKMISSPIGRAMASGEAGRAYLGYSQSNTLKDNRDFIGPKPAGGSWCVYGFKIDGSIYYMWACEDDVLFLSDRHIGDKTVPVLALTTDDHGIDTRLLTKNIGMTKRIKKAYGARKIVFDNMRAKQAFLEIYRRL